MIDEKRAGKYISYLLRHHPEDAGLQLDPHGWAVVEELLDAIRPKYSMTREDLENLMEHGDKQRYELDETGTKIRAVHGHSIPVDLKYEPVDPPVTLYHGSADRFEKSILEKGILSQNRMFVHLSTSAERAIEVGRRHGKVILFSVAAEEMQKDGYKFYHSASDIYLTKEVPPKYLKKIER